MPVKGCTQDWRGASFVAQRATGVSQRSEPCLPISSGSRAVRRSPIKMKVRGCIFIVPMMKCG